MYYHCIVGESLRLPRGIANGVNIWREAGFLAREWPSASPNYEPCLGFQCWMDSGCGKGCGELQADRHKIVVSEGVLLMCFNLLD